MVNKFRVYNCNCNESYPVANLEAGRLLIVELFNKYYPEAIHKDLEKMLDIFCLEIDDAEEGWTCACNLLKNHEAEMN